MSHGGARQGAGRPKGLNKYGVATKPVRVPVNLINDIQVYIENKGYKLPVYSSRVAAGAPVAADSYVDDHISLQDYLVRDARKTFIVQVEGESMIDAGIHEGDLLMVDSGLNPRQGQVIVASVDGNMTVKRLDVQKNGIRLLPENEEYDPIPVSQYTSFKILGVVTHSIKKFQ